MEQNDLTFKAEISLYYDMFVPDGAQHAPLLIAVHGYGAHKRYMMREAKLVAPENFVIASVQGPHQHFRPTENGYRIGFGWLTEHKPEEYVRLHHVFLLNVVDKLDRDGLIDRSQIYLYGFSQSCALNFRFAFTHPEVARAIVAVCGGIPGDLESNPSYTPFAADTLYLYGNDDEFYTEEKFAGYEKKLREMLPNFQSRQFNAKHEITEEMRIAIKEFLNEKAPARN
jgi:predicted esterase